MIAQDTRDLTDAQFATVMRRRDYWAAICRQKLDKCPQETPCWQEVLRTGEYCAVVCECLRRRHRLLAWARLVRADLEGHTEPVRIAERFSSGFDIYHLPVGELECFRCKHIQPMYGKNCNGLPVAGAPEWYVVNVQDVDDGRWKTIYMCGSCWTGAP